MQQPRRPIPMQRSRLVVIVFVAVIAAACSSPSSGGPTPTATTTSASGTPSPVVSASPSPSATPAGPATAEFDLVGSGGLTAPVTVTYISCNVPTLDGPQITVLGKVGTTGVGFVFFLHAGTMEVRVGTGAAESLRLRTFTGTGVTGFDAASGAQIDSELTETTPAGSQVGTLGALTSVKGSIDCGDQVPGTSDVTVSGQTPSGPIDGTLGPFRVQCTIVGLQVYVNVTGLTMTGGTSFVVAVTASTGLLQLAASSKAGGAFYTVSGAGVATIVPNGAHFAGDVVRAASGSEPKLTIHVAGDATCGSTVTQ